MRGISGTPLICDDTNPCTDDSCNPSSGCAFTDNTESCDDGNACTTSDACSGGSCQGGPPLSCDDGLFCNGEESCDPGSGCQAGTERCALINNGLAPPNPENVIDSADDYSGDQVYVRNVGCPDGWPAVLPDDPCPSPGAATEVEVVSGGTLWYDLRAYDTSTVTMSGGTVMGLRAYGSSSIALNGGTVEWGLHARDSSSLTMSGGTAHDLYAYGSPTVTISGGTVGTLGAFNSSTVTVSGGTVGMDLVATQSATITVSGGTVGGDMEAYDSSIITFIGSDFMVDGVPVPYGDLTALAGTLTGTLALGDSLNNVFYQGGYAGTYTGTITLVEAPVCVNDHCVINNGLAPPNPANVIDDSTYANDVVYVRNVGCPHGWPAVLPDDPCPFPGGPTEVEVTDGGYVGPLSVYDFSTFTMNGGYVLDGVGAYDSSTVTMNEGYLFCALIAYDSSTITMNGGGVERSVFAYGSATVTMRGGRVGRTGPPDGSLIAHDTSTVTMSGGSLWLNMVALDTSTITMNGGTLGDDLLAYDDSIITLIGSNFMVDGTPVPYGDLNALTGTLTGDLALGGSLDNVFYQGGYSGTYTGTITLVPEPDPVPSLSPVGVALLGGLVLAIAVGGLAVQRRRRAG